MKTGKSNFTIEPTYRTAIAEILATFKPTEADAAPKRGPGRPRKVVAEIPMVHARRRGRVNGFVVLPSDALKNWAFWTQLVVMANEAVRRRSHLVLETDGYIVKVRQAQ